MNYKRNLPGNKIYDPASTVNNTYNDKAGAQKNTEVGSKLLPIQISGSYTTDCSTRRALPAKGKNLAIYNNAGAVGAVTTGDATVTALAAGVADANGKVGVPCPAGQWIFLAAGEDTHVIATAATLLVFLIDDESSLTPDNAR